MTRLTQKSRVSMALAAAVAVGAALLGQPAAAADPLVVRDFVLTRDIDGREPVDSVATFGPADTEAVAFARIDNRGAPTTVTFKWHRGSRQHAAVQMRVGTSSGWRTWSSANLRPGDWRVELLDADGVVLMEDRFRVSRTPVAQAAMPVAKDDDPVAAVRRSAAAANGN